jgi:hypothetical protein
MNSRDIENEMPNKCLNKGELRTEIGVATNFPGKYYALVDTYKANYQESRSLLDFVDFFEENDFRVKKNTQENFFSIREDLNPEWGINVAPSGDSLEVIFVSPCLGFTFHGLAHEIAAKAYPDLVRNPPYPRIPIPTEDKIYELAEYVYKMYLDLKSEIKE